MKLQKLVYYAYGWYYAYYKKPLFDEKIEAWKFGPVIRSVYDKFKRFGNYEINRFATKLDVSDGDDPKFEMVRYTLEDAEVKIFLNKIWGLYKGLSAVQLSNLSHVSGGPWNVTVQQAINNYGYLPENEDIDPNTISKYFQSELKRFEDIE